MVALYVEAMLGLDLKPPEAVSRRLRVWGAVLGGMHLIVSAVIIVPIATRPLVAQWQFSWIPLMVIDLPLTIVGAPLEFLLSNVSVPMSLKSVLPDGGLQSVDGLFSSLLHGVVGPIFYYVLPLLVWQARESRRRRPSAY